MFFTCILNTGNFTVITIEDTIIRAIEIRGSEVLRRREVFCAVIEDLAPHLGPERVFLEQIYTDELGTYLFQAARTDYPQRNKLLRDAQRYLLETCGYSDLYRDRFYEIFRQVLIGKVFEVRRRKDYLSALKRLKNTFADDLNEDVLRFFVDENRLFLRFSLTVDDVREDLKRL